MLHRCVALAAIKYRVLYCFNMTLESYNISRQAAVSQGEPLYYSALVLLTSEVKNYTSRFWCRHKRLSFGNCTNPLRLFDCETGLVFRGNAVWIYPLRSFSAGKSWQSFCWLEKVQKAFEQSECTNLLLRIFPLISIFFAMWSWGFCLHTHPG